MLSLGLLLFGQLTPLLGVVTIAKGDVDVIAPATATFSVAKSGLLLHDDDAIETGENGWVEVLLSSGLTARLAASSQLKFNRRFLVLGSGRVWIQSMAQKSDETEELRVWGGRLTIKGGSTLIAERVKGRGVNITVIRGEGHVAIKNSPAPNQVIHAGQSYWLNMGPRNRGPQKTSKAIWALVESEARSILGDRLGLEQYLLTWLQKVDLGVILPRSAWETPQMESSIRGEAGTLFDSLLEAAIRPAPFLENEVPPKGPNVRVEVNFEGS